MYLDVAIFPRPRPKWVADDDTNYFLYNYPNTSVRYEINDSSLLLVSHPAAVATTWMALVRSWRGAVTSPAILDTLNWFTSRLTCNVNVVGPRWFVVG